VTITRTAKAEGGCAIVLDTFGAQDVTLLPGGCACCTVRAELQSSIWQLRAEREAKPFSRVVIETKQELGPILRTFISERTLGSEYYVEDEPSLDGSRFVLTDDEPMSWGAFSRFITALTTLRGPDLLRVEGLVNIEGCRGPVAVEFMGHLAARPIELQAWPDDEHATRLEFVTRDVEERTIRDLFSAMRALA